MADDAVVQNNTDLDTYIRQQIGLLQQEDTRLAGLITALTERVSSLEGKAHDISYSDGTLTISKEASE